MRLHRCPYGHTTDNPGLVWTVLASSLSRISTLRFRICPPPGDGCEKPELTNLYSVISLSYGCNDSLSSEIYTTQDFVGFRWTMITRCQTWIYTVENRQLATDRFPFAFPAPCPYNTAMESQATVLCETEKKLWLIPCGRQSAVSRHGKCHPRRWTRHRFCGSSGFSVLFMTAHPTSS